jgi:hypothetical protein
MAIVTGIPGPAFPGSALIGQATPGDIGPVTVPPAPNLTGGIVVGTTPVLLASSAAAADMYPSGECYITNGVTPVYLGGSANVTTSNGFPFAASASAPPIHLYPGDTIFAVTATGTSIVYVTQTGS